MNLDRLNRVIFNTGISILRDIIIVSLLLGGYRYYRIVVANDYIEMSLLVAIGLYLILLLNVYQYAIEFTNLLIKKVSRAKKRSRAIEVLEFHNIRVGIVTGDLPDVRSKEEYHQCFNAFSVLRRSNNTLITMDSQLKTKQQVCFLGKYGYSSDPYYYNIEVKDKKVKPDVT